MSKRDYIFISALIASCQGAPNAREEIARGIARHCANQNPHFDKQAFLDECEVWNADAEE